MPVSVNCQHNDGGAWCKNKLVKRSLFGIGARCCVEYPPSRAMCAFKLQWPRPPMPRSQVPKGV